jgi:hypothetical protein
MRQTLVTMTLGLGLLGCGGGGSGAEPEAVVRDYLQGVAEGNLARAKSAWMTPEVIAAHFDCPAAGAKLPSDAERRDKDLGREIDKRNKRRVELVAIEATTPGSVDEGAELGGCRAKAKTDTVELKAALKVVREGKPDVQDTDPVRLAKVAGRWYLTSF